VFQVNDFAAGSLSFTGRSSGKLVTLSLHLALKALTVTVIGRLNMIQSHA